MRAEQAADALERGFRRLCWQWIEADGDHGRAVVMAVRHRRPVTIPVSAAVAHALHRRGVPTIVRPPATAGSR